MAPGLCWDGNGTGTGGLSVSRSLDYPSPYYLGDSFSWLSLLPIITAGQDRCSTVGALGAMTVLAIICFIMAFAKATAADVADGEDHNDDDDVDDFLEAELDQLQLLFQLFRYKFCIFPVFSSSYCLFYTS